MTARLGGGGGGCWWGGYGGRGCWLGIVSSISFTGLRSWQTAGTLRFRTLNWPLQLRTGADGFIGADLRPWRMHAGVSWYYWSIHCVCIKDTDHEDCLCWIKTPPPSVLFFNSHIHFEMSMLSLFFYSLTFPTLVWLWCLKNIKKICNPLLWIYLHSLLNQPHFPFPLLFLCSLCNNRPPIHPAWLYMSRNRRVGKCARQHVCNTNNIHHTVQMAVPLSLWSL